MSRKNSLKIFHENVPNGDDVAYRACQHKEVEYRVHIPFLIKGIEHGASDVCHTLGDDPYDGSRGYRVNERLEGHQHAQSHSYEAERLDIGMFFQSDEADDGAGDGAQPYEREERPAPVKGKG